MRAHSSASALLFVGVLMGMLGASCVETNAAKGARDDSQKSGTTPKPDKVFSALCQAYHEILDVGLELHLNPKFKTDYKPYAMAMAWKAFLQINQDKVYDQDDVDIEAMLSQRRTFAASSEGKKIAQDMQAGCLPLHAYRTRHPLVIHTKSGGSQKVGAGVADRTYFYQLLNLSFVTLDGVYSQYHSPEKLKAMLAEKETPLYTLGIDLRYFSTGFNTALEKGLPYLTIDHVEKTASSPAAPYASQLEGKRITHLDILKNGTSLFETGGTPLAIEDIMRQEDTQPQFAHFWQMDEAYNASPQPLQFHLVVEDTNGGTSEIKLASSNALSKKPSYGMRITPDTSGQARAGTGAAKNDIAYLRLGSFQSLEAVESLTAAWNEITKGGPAPDALIMDFRGNGGGYAEEANHFMSYFLKQNTVSLYTAAPGREKEAKVFRTKNEWATFAEVKNIVVLLDHNSASAAELTAASLRYYGKALVLANAPSHGKFVGGGTTAVKSPLLPGGLSFLMLYALLPDHSCPLYQGETIIDVMIADSLSPPASERTGLKDSLSLFNYYGTPSIPDPRENLDLKQLPSVEAHREPPLISAELKQQLLEIEPPQPASCDPNADWEKVDPTRCMIDAAIYYLERMRSYRAEN